MSTLEYRWLNEADIKAQMSLERECQAEMQDTPTAGFTTYYSDEEKRALLRGEGGQMLGVFDGKRLVGQLIVEYVDMRGKVAERFDFNQPLPQLDGKGCYYRNSLVAPSHRGRGIYMDMFRHIMPRSADAKRLNSCFTVHPDNKAVYKMAEVMGFTRVGTATRRSDKQVMDVFIRPPMAQQRVA